MITGEGVPGTSLSKRMNAQNEDGRGAGGIVYPSNRRSQSELKVGLNSECGGASPDKINPLALDL